MIDDDDLRYTRIWWFTAIIRGLVAGLIVCGLLWLSGCAPSLDCRASWAGVATAHDAECAHAASYGAWR